MPVVSLEITMKTGLKKFEILAINLYFRGTRLRKSDQRQTHDTEFYNLLTPNSHITSFFNVLISDCKN